jgi:HSP20 family protein
LTAKITFRAHHGQAGQNVRLDFARGNDYLLKRSAALDITSFSGAIMPRFSGRKPFTQEIFNRHVGEMRSLLHALELRELFEDHDYRPKMDMYETCHDIIIEFDLPGFALESISLKVDGMTLILEASKPREQCEGKFICVERSHGRFHHAVHIPGNVDPGAITAQYRRGVLRVSCPKSGERLVPIVEL